MFDGDFLEKAKENLNPIDFGRGFYQGTIGKPVNGISQLAGAEVEKEEAPATLAGKAGYIGGQIVDFAALAVVSRGALKPLLKKAIDSTGGTAASMFLAGSVDGAVLTASEPGGNIWRDRMQQGLINGTTFAIMGGATKAMDAKAIVAGSSFADKSLKSALAGGLGGAAHANVDSLLKTGELASVKDTALSSGQYALFGAGLHAFGAGVKKVAELPAVDSARLNIKWKAQEGYTEARREAYKVLNELNLRHPLQRVGDAIYGKPEVAVPAKVPLTAENHPVGIFEREFPLYIKKVTEGNNKLDLMQAEADAAREAARKAGVSRFERGKEPTGNSNADRHEVWEGIGETHAQFMEKLMGVWFGKPAANGQPAKPGMVSYSDAELAAGGHSIERVAAIRSALNQSMKRESYHGPSPFEEAMSKLAPPSTPMEGKFEMLRGLGQARERFFEFNETEMMSKLSLSTEHHIRNRAYDTPTTWMPFEPSATLANLFHTTVSRALPSTLIERGLLPAREMRLRGITQATGESSNEQFGRQVISMTRNFSESFCYHRHSVDFLTDFPLVWGISKNVAGRSRPAGMTERGELVIDRLRVGETLGHRLGLTKPDVTHVYVPDSQVQNVIQTFANYRVPGVKVVGFNQMETPKWKPENISDIPEYLR